MPNSQRPLAPVSARHAFALAFDLAARRDPVQSLLVPALLRGPWILIPALLSPLDHPDAGWPIFAVAGGALIVDFLLLLLTCGMMRFRARSVFNTTPGTRPAPALECYARALARLPWLFATELVRSLAIIVSAIFLLVPALLLSFRLSCATEAVVLDEPRMLGAFMRSFRLTEGRFERWLEMVTLSTLIGLGVIFVMTILAVLVPQPGVAVWFAATQVVLVLVTTIIQYAWTFFYLRLVEVETPAVEVGPFVAESGKAPLQTESAVLEEQESLEAGRSQG